MMTAEIRTLGVVGTGVIGSSWTALFLSHGKKVLVADPAEGAESRLRDYIKDIWDAVPKTDGASMEHLTFVGKKLTTEHLQSVDFIQENGPEKLDLKTSLIAALDADSRPEVPICSSSSGLIPSSFIGDCKNAPQRILVGHPWNPPHIMPLVEIVPHPNTSQDAVQKAESFYRNIGKRPIVLKKEVPGFVGNRLQAAIGREAYSLVANGVCDAEAVELAMTQALGPRWALTGPFMTNILGGGGNPGGFTTFGERLGPAFRSWKKDMDEKVKIEEDDGKRQDVIQRIEEGLGRVDTKTLERQRNEVLVRFLEDRGLKDELENYALRQD